MHLTAPNGLHGAKLELPYPSVGATEQALLGRLISSQEELRPLLGRLVDSESGGFDEATRNHIRNMDVYLARILDETVPGRSQMTHELRSEIKMVARTIAAAAPSSSRPSSHPSGSATRRWLPDRPRGPSAAPPGARRPAAAPGGARL